MSNFEDNAKALMSLMNKEVETIKQEKYSWEKQKQINQKIKFKETDIINLNVGGVLYTTTHQTITQKVDSNENYFTTMFSGRFDMLQDEKKNYFIDRDGRHFFYILNYLRAGGIMDKVVFPKDKSTEEELKLEFEYYHLEWPVKTPEFCSALIELKELNKLNEWIGYSGGWELIYQATKDGFGASEFHSKCDGMGPTLSIIKSESGYIFGGYTPIEWDTSSGYRIDKKTFLFSFLNGNGRQMVKMAQNTSNNSSTFSKNGYMMTFGGGHDLYICSDSHKNNTSYSNLGASFSLSGYSYGSSQIENYLAGSKHFKIVEIEVWCQS